eukprot:tig00000310_g23957.t1
MACGALAHFKSFAYFLDLLKLGRLHPEHVTSKFRPESDLRSARRKGQPSSLQLLRVLWFTEVVPALSERIESTGSPYGCVMLTYDLRRLVEEYLDLLQATARRPEVGEIDVPVRAEDRCRFYLVETHVSDGVAKVRVLVTYKNFDAEGGDFEPGLRFLGNETKLEELFFDEESVARLRDEALQAVAGEAPGVTAAALQFLFDLPVTARGGRYADLAHQARYFGWARSLLAVSIVKHDAGRSATHNAKLKGPAGIHVPLSVEQRYATTPLAARALLLLTLLPEDNPRLRKSWIAAQVQTRAWEGAPGGGPSPQRLLLDAFLSTVREDLGLPPVDSSEFLASYFPADALEMDGCPLFLATTRDAFEALCERLGRARGLRRLYLRKALGPPPKDIGNLRRGRASVPLYQYQAELDEDRDERLRALAAAARQLAPAPGAGYRLLVDISEQHANDLFGFGEHLRGTAWDALFALDPAAVQLHAATPRWSENGRYKFAQRWPASALEPVPPALQSVPPLAHGGDVAAAAKVLALLRERKGRPVEAARRAFGPLFGGDPGRFWRAVGVLLAHSMPALLLEEQDGGPGPASAAAAAAPPTAARPATTEGFHRAPPPLPPPPRAGRQAAPAPCPTGPGAPAPARTPMR